MIREAEQQLREHNKALMELAKFDFLDKGSLYEALKVVLKAVKPLSIIKGSTWLFSNEQTTLKCVAQYDSKLNRFSSGFVYNEDDYPVYFSALKSAKVLAIRNAKQDPRIAEFGSAYFSENDISSMLIMPLFRKDIIIGILCLECSLEDRDWSKDDISFASNVCYFVVEIILAYEKKDGYNQFILGEEWLDIALGGRDMGLWSWNVETGEVDFNDGWASILGYETNNDQNASLKWENLVHPEDQPYVIDMLQKNISRELDVIDMEHRIKTFGGEWKWVRSRGKLVKLNRNGKPLRVNGIHFDISREKKVREGRLEDAEKYMMLFEKNPDPLWVFDLETFEFLIVNEAAVHHYGYSEDEFMTMTIRDIRPKEDIPLLIDHMQNRIDKYQNAGVWRHMKKGGEVIYVEIKSQVITFGDHPAVLVLAKDVTARVKAQEEITKNESLFRSLFENSPLSTILLDNNGKIIKANKAFEELFLFKNQEIRGMTPEAFIVPKGVKEKNKENANEILKGYFFNKETKRKTKDNKILDVSIFGVPIKVSEKLKYFLKIYIDLTYTKKIQRELNLTNLELQTLMYQSSHNLKGPVATIKGLLNLLHRDKRDNFERYLQMIEKTTNRLDEILVELLDISYINSNLPKIESIKISDVIENLLIDFQQQIEERNILLKVNGDIGTIIKSDKNILHSILYHLLDNSVKYSYGIKKPTITLDVRVNKVMTVISVEDNGEGIKPEYMDRIFNMFYRANEKSEGSGLGLYFVKKGVERLNGNIEAQSVPLKKTRFTVAFETRSPS